MTPCKRARRGEWVSPRGRGLHVAIVCQGEKACILWRVVGTIACCFRAKLVLGPPHYHDTLQTCQMWRVGISTGSRSARGKSVPRSARGKCVTRRENMHLVACGWDYRVLFSGQVGAWSTTLP